MRRIPNFHPRLRAPLVLLSLLILAATVSAQTATRVYWTEWYNYHPELSRIARSNVDGLGVETLMDGFDDGVGCKDLAVDAEAGKLYFANRSAGLIERTNLDGTERETVLSGVSPIGLALDVAGGRIYWSDYTYSNPRLRRANLDGTGVQDLVTASAGCQLEGIALDLAAGHLYWAERMTQRIKRSNLDGTGVTLLLACWEGIGHPCGLALAAGRIYWASDESIVSATLAGEDVQILVDDLADAPRSLEVDPFLGRLYWVTGGMTGAMVQRISLDGTNLETLVSGLYYGYGLALEITDAVPVPEVVLPQFQLRSYPNPFNPATTVSFDLPWAQHVTLEVFAPNGVRLATLDQGWREAGPHALRWDGRDASGRVLPSGVYLGQLSAEGGVSSRRLTLVK